MVSLFIFLSVSLCCLLAAFARVHVNSLQKILIASFTILYAPHLLASELQWSSDVTNKWLNVRCTEAEHALTDFQGKKATIIYLENLPFRKLGRNSNAEDVAWLLKEGYRVIEIDYAKDVRAVSPAINQDIISLNKLLNSGNVFGKSDCSKSQSYVLFEGYRIKRNVSYFKDDPSVYNSPDNYTEGDSLHMDIIYPAHTRKRVPIILSFSYSNSYVTYNNELHLLSRENSNQRVFLPYTFAGFNDTFLEGAPAEGIAWAIADHPKYCEWGRGKPRGGKNDTYKSYQANPDAARKVKSAIRTLRYWAPSLGLSGKIGIYGFSRGSTAGSLAVGDRYVADFAQAGLHKDISDRVQAAALGPGVFDYTLIYDQKNDGDGNLELRCPWAWGSLEQNRDLWQRMGASYLVKSKDSAPVLFFYNHSDDAYYAYQIKKFRQHLDSLGVPTSEVTDYGKGHAVPQTSASLGSLYHFFKKYLQPPSVGKSAG